MLCLGIIMCMPKLWLKKANMPIIPDNEISQIRKECKVTAFCKKDGILHIPRKMKMPG